MLKCSRNQQCSLPRSIISILATKGDLKKIFFVLPSACIGWNSSIKDFPSATILSWNPLYIGKTGWMFDLCSLFTNFQNNEPVFWKFKTRRKFWNCLILLLLSLYICMFDGCESMKYTSNYLPHYNFILRIHSLHCSRCDPRKTHHMMPICQYILQCFPITVGMFPKLFFLEIST